MNNKSENLKSLVVSINALEKKAFDINERIKKHSKSQNSNRIKNKTKSKDTSYSKLPYDNKSLEIKENIDNLNILELENKLKKELLELKNKQKDFKYNTLRHGDYIYILNYFIYRNEFY